MADPVEVMVARIDERTRKMEEEICAKCKRIDSHEDRLKRLEWHDYAEISIVGIGGTLIAWLIAAGFLHA